MIDAMPGRPPARGSTLLVDGGALACPRCVNAASLVGKAIQRGAHRLRWRDSILRTRSRASAGTRDRAGWAARRPRATPHRRLAAPTEFGRGPRCLGRRPGDSITRPRALGARSGGRTPIAGGNHAANRGATGRSGVRRWEDHRTRERWRRLACIPETRLPTTTGGGLARHCGRSCALDGNGPIAQEDFRPSAIVAEGPSQPALNAAFRTGVVLSDFAAYLNEPRQVGFKFPIGIRHRQQRCLHIFELWVVMAER